MSYTAIIAWRRVTARFSDTAEWLKETLIVIMGLTPLAILGAALLLM